MDRTEKFKLLRQLEFDGVIRELCPMPSYWRYEVLKPELLPASLKEGYERFGEIRW